VVEQQIILISKIIIYFSQNQSVPLKVCIEKASDVPLKSGTMGTLWEHFFEIS